MRLRLVAESGDKEYSANLSDTSAHILWTDLSGCPKDFPEKLRLLFPSDEAQRIRQFIREPDRRLRYATVCLLADLVVSVFGQHTGIIFVRNNFGRLCISGVNDTDISISHSGEIVVCALSRRGYIGIDIEQLRPIVPDDFQNVFPYSLTEWMRADSNKTVNKDGFDESFFHAWTRFESVIKADGRGFSAPFSDIVFDNQKAYLDNETWYLSTIPIVDGYICSVATFFSGVEFDIKYVAYTG